jgi:multidrug efflux pump subunit AcrA (membrane-fusion protein)
MSFETYEIKTPPSPTTSRSSPGSTAKALRRLLNAFARVLRISASVAGAVLVCFLLVNWLAVPAFVPKTSEAVVNAPITSQRAESEGAIRIAHQVGDTVKKGDILASSANTYLNEAPVWRLKTAKANLEAELARVLADLDIVKRLRDTSRQELDKYRASLMQELTISQKQTEAKIAELTAVRDQSMRLAELNRTLSQDGAGARDTYYRAAEDVAIAERRLEQGRAEKEGIANQLAATARDVFIQRDSPIYLTLYMQFQQSVSATEAKVAETKSRLEAAICELDQADSFERRLAGGAVISPVAGVIWRVNASSGPLAKGEPLFEIAEAQHAFIEAQFQESFSASLYPGAKAIINVSGLPPLTGTVRAFRQTSPTDLDNAYAMRLPRRLNQLKVYIDIDRSMLIAPLVGRQCRVLVADRNARPFTAKSPFFSLTRLAEWLSVKLFVLFGW